LRHKALHPGTSAYLAALGRGRRPDFLASFGGLYIKTLEGSDPNVTVTAVWSYHCVPALESYQGDPYCSLIPNPRIFRFAGDAPPQEVTAQLWPGQPVITLRQKAYIDRHGGSDPYLMVSKLAYAPTVEWQINYDPHLNFPSQRALPRGWADGHLGFVTWTGTRFKRSLTVPRRLWPCAPVPKGEAPCSQENELLYPVHKYITP
jgi:hypothetical protein